jgi:hypothetical protein
VLESSVSPNEQLISELEKVVFDESTAPEERREALAALGSARSEVATDALLRVLHGSDPRLQARSALHLLNRDLPRFRPQVEEIVRTWPEDPPYPADEVIELLTESAGGDGR